ncbi:MAG: ribosome silencing factor [Candidatus Eremiobacteraeota bacterium]|nr:ribosome silencing factor [Candidatus Eremiobacteraeota bacterium]MDQ6823264.1 ribosome silencing factor [Candidatus Eremiobacteraeota bacterium]
MAGKSIIADTFVIVTGRSKIQTRSIADNIGDALKRSDLHVPRVEGYSDGNWILLDCGTVIVHIFTPEQRTFYNLERLWVDAAARQVGVL